MQIPNLISTVGKKEEIYWILTEGDTQVKRGIRYSILTDGDTQVNRGVRY